MAKKWVATDFGSSDVLREIEVEVTAPRSGEVTITVSAKDVLAKTGKVSFAEAANLLLAGTTAADMLEVARISEGDTIVLHGASGAVGVSALQQARLIGAHVIGT